MKTQYLLPVVLTLLLGPARTFAETLYSEDFDTDPTENWTLRLSGADAFADFYFDYGSELGIPAAPNSSGTTRGLRFLCNQSARVFQGISATPNGQGFTGNYRLRFDMWLNYNGPLNGGGNGSTQCGSFGVGATGSSVMWAGGAPAAIMFAVTGDGGSSDDYRCYSNSVHLVATSGAYAAGTTTDARNNTNPYYSTNFGNATAPAAQVTLFPQQTGATTAGAAGFAWRDVIVEKIDNTVTMTIDGKLIATSQTPPSFSTNIFLGMFDINGTESSDANDHLIASIFDNVRVESLGSSVSVNATAAIADENGTPGEFTFTRTGDTSSALTVDFVVSGTALNGTDYTTIPTSITFEADETTKTISIQPSNDSIAEVTETVIVTISTSQNYGIGTGASTVSIMDNETPELTISVVSSNMYERIADDYLKFRITRLGDIAASFQINVSYAGQADPARYIGPTLVDLESGAATADFNVSPLNDTLLNGDESITATLVTGSGYELGATVEATGIIVDDEYPTETILFSDTLADDNSSQWTQRFGANNLVEDSVVGFAYPLAADFIPDAPSGATSALKLTVNKLDPTENGAAGINFYPNDQNFSSDFAVRFDMYIQQNSSVGTTEFALFGINHSGSKTNWVRQNGTSVYNNPPKDCDGLWFSVISDASGSAPGDYVLLTGGATANDGPVILTTAAATAFTQAFKRPPYSSGSGAGAPGNLPSSATKSWADVEVKKIGDVVSLSINKTPVLQYTNTTSYNSGNIMLGYMDPYESVGSAGGAVYYSNLRVVEMETTITQPNVTAIRLINSGTQVEIDFTGGADDTFTLQSSSTVSGGYADTAASITSTGTGTFRATANVSGATQFYRIKR